MDSISPVFTEKEVEIEKVIALEQAQYYPIIGLPVIFADGIQGMAVRFRLNDEEKKRIANGADLIFTELTYGRDFTPISINLADPGEYSVEMKCEG